MKIALLTDGIDPYVIGGMQKHSYYLAKYFARNGVYVDLYHTSFRGERSPGLESVDCFSEDEKKYIRSFVVDFPRFAMLPGHYLKESYEYSKRIFNMFQGNSNVDFVYAKGFAGWKLIEEKKKGYKCPPVGVKFHGMNMYDRTYSLRSKLEQWLLRPAADFNLANADHVFSYGGKVTGLLLDKAHVPAEKIIEIPAAIEENWITTGIRPPSGLRKFIFSGRYDKIKGIEPLMQAIEQLSGLNFEFHFIGPFPDHKKIVSDKIIYHGPISGVEKMRSIYRSCDVLVCPSYSEGMPNVILEAMASGLAVIATDVGAVRCMVSTENGWLLNAPDPSEIVKAMKRAIELPSSELTDKKKASVIKVNDYFLWKDIILRVIKAVRRDI